MADYKDAADRFKQIGERRLRQAQKQLKLIGNLSASGYYYTPAQVDTIRNALQSSLDAAMSRFDRKSSESVEIKL